MCESKPVRAALVDNPNKESDEEDISRSSSEMHLQEEAAAEPQPTIKTVPTAVLQPPSSAEHPVTLSHPSAHPHSPQDDGTRKPRALNTTLATTPNTAVLTVNVITECATASPPLLGGSCDAAEFVTAASTANSPPLGSSRVGASATSSTDYSPQLGSSGVGASATLSTDYSPPLGSSGVGASASALGNINKSATVISVVHYSPPLDSNTNGTVSSTSSLCVNNEIQSLTLGSRADQTTAAAAAEVGTSNSSDVSVNDHEVVGAVIMDASRDIVDLPSIGSGTPPYSRSYSPCSPLYFPCSPSHSPLPPSYSSSDRIHCCCSSLPNNRRGLCVTNEIQQPTPDSRADQTTAAAVASVGSSNTSDAVSVNDQDLIGAVTSRDIVGLPLIVSGTPPCTSSCRSPSYCLCSPSPPLGSITDVDTITTESAAASSTDYPPPLDSSTTIEDTIVTDSAAASSTDYSPPLDSNTNGIDSTTSDLCVSNEIQPSALLAFHDDGTAAAAISRVSSSSNGDDVCVDDDRQETVNDVIMDTNSSLVTPSLIVANECEADIDSEEPSAKRMRT